MIYIQKYEKKFQNTNNSRNREIIIIFLKKQLILQYGIAQPRILLVYPHYPYWC